MIYGIYNKRNLCFKFRDKFVILLKQEKDVISQNEHELVMIIRKILMMSVNGTIHLHALNIEDWIGFA